jgi:hypothetical protein
LPEGDPAALWRVFYRVAAIAIVLFWLVMTGLLVRLECFPGAADLLPVPVSHLFKLMFLHEQPSDLILFQDHARIGDFHLQPHRFPPNAGATRNLLAVTGSMILNLPGFEARHLTFRGAFELDDRDDTRRFELTATVHDPAQNRLVPPSAPAQPAAPNLVIVFDGEPLRNHYHYAVRSGEAVVAERAGPPATLLDQPELRSLGVSPAVLSGLVQQQAASTQVSARRGVLQSKGAEIETYDVTIRQGDTVEATIQLSQLGQILMVQTFAGYTLRDESLAP